MINTTSVKQHPIVHPNYGVEDGDQFPEIIKGEGIFVKDTLGNHYIDAISGLWNVSLGYNHPKVNQAIVEQLDNLAYFNLGDFQNPAATNLANKILGLLPSNFEKLIYTNSGSESVELSIKLARQYQFLKRKKGKTDFIVLENSYHGAYYASMSASGIEREITKVFSPVVPGFHFLECPFKENIGRVTLETINFINENHTTLAGIILEPIVGSGGIISIPQTYLEQIKVKCEQYDILLIFDEVATGFGRTGHMFAFEDFNVIPDIICFSKGINSGYLPLAALVFNDRVCNTLSETKAPINHLSTQNGNPVSCAAGVATIDTILEEDFVNKVQSKGEFLLRSLRECLGKYPNVSDIRGKGLMIGIELKKNGQNLTYNEIKSLIKDARKKGLIIYGFTSEPYTSGISLFPPFITSNTELKMIAKVIESLVRRI